MFEPEVIKKLLNPRNLESLKLSKVDLESMRILEINLLDICIDVKLRTGRNGWLRFQRPHAP